ncbi:MAG: Ltp family lipoprotein [Clostridia bacterium]|nr:Ltp family lipoprotein [Clostridia bacterium]
MFKRSLIILIAAAMLISIAACSNKTNTTENGDETGQVAVETEQKPKFEIPDDVEFTDTQLAAAESAQAHLEVGVSRPKLISALIEEGHSEEDAVYAVDAFGIDWMEMARGTAEFYIYYMPFSYQGMLDHLKYMEFTDEEAQYGVDSLDTDWDNMAKKYIEKYYMYHAYSDDDLLAELVKAGFTEEQAKAGIWEYKDDRAEESKLREELGLD